ncbi:MAG: hypothetical protein OEV91_03840, partial [Desulfobulbaceae bacterium]|nr:hypothetical protein [Desulfobulbaceae bacterium]
MLCKACLVKGEVVCGECGATMPAGRGKLCEDCYWQNTFSKRLKIDQAAFSSTAMADAFSEFGAWLLGEVGGKKAALSIHRYLEFFLENEKCWRRIPGYAELLSRFGAEGLRRVRLPMRWLSEAYGVVPDAGAREGDSDLRRIKKILASFQRGTPAAQELAGYHARLMERVG